MNQFLLVLVTALITGIVSVTGIWFGSNLTRGNEDWKWRRDHALEAYTNFIQAVDVFRAEADKMYITKICGDDAHTKQAELLLEKLLEVDRITNRIFLLAPTEVAGKANALASHFTKEIAPRSIKCPKTSEAERDAEMKKTAELQVDFLNAARNDLGIHPPRYSVEEWTTILASEKPWWKFGP